MAITISNLRAEYENISPVASMPTDDFFNAVRSIDTQEIKDVVLPDFLKYYYLTDNLAIGIYEIPPRVYRLKWSNCRKYDAHRFFKNVSLPFPYTVIGLSFYRSGSRAAPAHSVIFFRNSSLEKLEDELFSPPLFNILQRRVKRLSGFANWCLDDFSWICSDYISEVPNDRNIFFTGLKSFITGFFESGFTNNMDGESAYEKFSYNVNNWEKMSVEDAVVHGWPKSPLTMRQYVDGIINKTPRKDTNFFNAVNQVFAKGVYKRIGREIIIEHGQNPLPRQAI